MGLAVGLGVCKSLLRSMGEEEGVDAIVFYFLLDKASHRDNDSSAGDCEKALHRTGLGNMHSVLYLASDTREAL